MSAQFPRPRRQPLFCCWGTATTSWRWLWSSLADEWKSFPFISCHQVAQREHQQAKGELFAEENHSIYISRFYYNRLYSTFPFNLFLIKPGVGRWKGWKKMWGIAKLISKLLFIHSIYFMPSHPPSLPLWYFINIPLTAMKVGKVKASKGQVEEGAAGKETEQNCRIGKGVCNATKRKMKVWWIN